MQNNRTRMFKILVLVLGVLNYSSCGKSRYQSAPTPEVQPEDLSKNTSPSSTPATQPGTGQNQSSNGNQTEIETAPDADLEYVGPKLAPKLQLRDFDALGRAMTQIAPELTAAEHSAVFETVKLNLPKDNREIDAFLPAHAIAQMQFAANICQRVLDKPEDIQKKFFGLNIGTGAVELTSNELKTIAENLLLRVGDASQLSLTTAVSAMEDIAAHIKANSAAVGQSAGMTVNIRRWTAHLGCGLILSSAFVSML